MIATLNHTRVVIIFNTRFYLTLTLYSGCFSDRKRDKEYLEHRDCILVLSQLQKRGNLCHSAISIIANNINLFKTNCIIQHEQSTPKTFARSESDIFSVILRVILCEEISMHFFRFSEIVPSDIINFTGIGTSDYSRRESIQAL